MVERHTYKTGKIYLIKCNITGEGYVGSTKVSLKDRLNRHQTDYRGFMGLLNTHRHYRGSAEIIHNENYTMHLVQDFPCETKRELEKQESLWMFKYTKIMKLTNKCIPHHLTYQDLETIEKLEFPVLHTI